jgi:hypothetical protein
VHTNEINPALKPRTTSANSMTNSTHVVVIQRDGQQAPPSRTGRSARKVSSSATIERAT